MNETDNKESEVENPDIPAQEAALPVDTEAPIVDVAALEAEKKKYFDQLLMLQAEFENFRKRVDREKPELMRHGRREVLERMIPLYDVLLAAHDQVAQSNGEKGELVRGLEMIFEEFTKLFEAEGVAVIASIGEKYDFDRHEVLGQVETDEYAEGVVVEELQRGYLIGGKVLRPAKVRIAKKKETQ